MFWQTQAATARSLFNAVGTFQTPEVKLGYLHRIKRFQSPMSTFLRSPIGFFDFCLSQKRWEKCSNLLTPPIEKVKNLQSADEFQLLTKSPDEFQLLTSNYGFHARIFAGWLGGMLEPIEQVMLTRFQIGGPPNHPLKEWGKKYFMLKITSSCIVLYIIH